MGKRLCEVCQLLVLNPKLLFFMYCHSMNLVIKKDEHLGPKPFYIANIRLISPDHQKFFHSLFFLRQLLKFFDRLLQCLIFLCETKANYFIIRTRLVKSRDRNCCYANFFCHPDAKIFISFVTNSIIFIALEIASITRQRGKFCLFHQLLEIVALVLHKVAKTEIRIFVTKKCGKANLRWRVAAKAIKLMHFPELLH